MAQTVNADHIAGLDEGTLEPQRQNNFTLRLTPPAGVSIPTSGGNGEQILALSIQQVPFPSEETQEQVTNFGNEVRKWAGRTTYSNETITVRDYVGAETSDIISQWRKVVYDVETGKIGYTYQYKTEGDLIFFGPDGEQLRRWRVWGIWPKRVKFGTGNMDSSEQNSIEVEFCVDKVFYDGIV